jgi:hypothetical protein
MAKEAQRKAWSKPQLGRLGEIKNFAGAQTPNAQATATKS